MWGVWCWGCETTGLLSVEGEQCELIPAQSSHTYLTHAPDTRQFEFKISKEKPSISNDVVTLHRKAAADHRVKLAITYALGQVR